MFLGFPVLPMKSVLAGTLAMETQGTGIIIGRYKYSDVDTNKFVLHSEAKRAIATLDYLLYLV